MVFTITPLYGFIVAVVWLILWLRVTMMRASLAQSIGDGGEQELLLRVRQHGNCHEWGGFVLLLMILAEGTGAPALYLHVSGVLLIIGRVAHPFGLKAHTASHPLRYVGNGTNIGAALIALFCIATQAL